MELIRVTEENIEQEHICCALSNNKDCQVTAKKQWMKQRFDDGLTFVKGNVRGKCFIEYIPAENAWAPIEADGYMYINCLWVSGQFKGHGYSNLLLDECIRDSKARGKKGLVILSSQHKKRPFLCDPQYLQHKGFVICDTAGPDYALMTLPFGADGGETPRFRAQVQSLSIAQQGFVVYYAHQCPFTAKYVPLLSQMAQEKNAPFEAIRFESAQQAQQAPAPFTSFSLFYNGVFVTNEILSPKKFETLLTEKGW